VVTRNGTEAGIWRGPDPELEGSGVFGYRELGTDPALLRLLVPVPYKVWGIPESIADTPLSSF